MPRSLYTQRRRSHYGEVYTFSELVTVQVALICSAGVIVANKHRFELIEETATTGILIYIHSFVIVIYIPIGVVLMHGGGLYFCVPELARSALALDSV